MRVLIIAPAWIGDAVMSGPLIACLADAGHTLDVAAPSWCAPVFACIPDVRAIHPLPLQHGRLDFLKRRAIGQSLRAEGYDWAIVLPNSWKSALIPWFARIPQRTGYVGEWRFGLLNDAHRSTERLLPKRYAMLSGLKIPESPSMPLWRVPPEEKAKAQSRMHASKPLLALCPGAEYGPAKRWPAEYFAAIAQRALEAGFQVAILGGPKDQGVEAEILHHIPSSQDLHALCGRTSLGEAIAMLEEASAVLSNDSGLMHIAGALQKPLVALYGSSDPSATPPSSPQQTLLSLKLSCSPCFQRTCPLGHLRCLRDLHPEMVWHALMLLVPSLCAS